MHQMDMDQSPRLLSKCPCQPPGRRPHRWRRAVADGGGSTPCPIHPFLGMSPWWAWCCEIRQVTVTSMAVVFTDDPSEKDPALEVDQVRCLEKAQGPVMAEVQGLWSWNKWLRHVVTAQPLQNGSPHPSALALSRDLSYPKPHTWVGSGRNPRTFYISLSCVALSTETQGQMVLVCNPIP